MGQRVESTSAVAGVVDPGAEDEVSSDGEERTTDVSFARLCRRSDLHDEEPSKEAPVASSVNRRGVLTGILCPPLESQCLDLLVLLCLVLVSAESQASVAVLAFAFRVVGTAPQLLFLLIAIFLLIVVLVIFLVAVVSLVSFETCSLFVAHKLDDGPLVDAALLVVEWKAPAVQDSPQTFSPSVGVGLGFSEQLELRVNIFAVLCFVGSGDVDGCYGRVSFDGKVDVFSNSTYCRCVLADSGLK